MSASRALLFIDWQQGLRDAGHFGGTRSTPDAEANASRLIETWRDRGWPVLHVKHNSTEPGSPLQSGTSGNSLEPFAEPRDGEPLFTKTVNSAFIGTDLQTHLETNNIQHLVVSGLTTDHCVSTTVRMAENLGFTVTLAGDACAAFGKVLPDGSTMSGDDIHRAHLASLHGEFATVAKTAEFLKGL